jgi:hypothetical protein
MSLEVFLAVAAILAPIVTWAIDKLALRVPKWIYWAVIAMSLIALVSAGVLSAHVQVAANSGTPKPIAPPSAPSQGILTVRDAKECPPGYNVLDSNLFEHNGTAISAPADAHICLVNNKLIENRTGMDIRPAGH